MTDEQLIKEFSQVVAETGVQIRRDRMRGLTQEQIEQKRSIVLNALRKLEAIAEDGERRNRLRRVK